MSVGMHSALLIAAPRHIRLLVDLREGRVERLRVVIVESTGLSVMLTGNHDDRVDFAAPQIAHSLVLCLMKTNSGDVTNALLTCLLGLFARLD